MIGVFDSGFGGLSILKEIVKELPQHEYVYLGDNARTPYGTRSSEVICGFAREAIEFLFSKNCELIIVACNTASAEALRKLQHEYVEKGVLPQKKILGVIVPAVEEAVEASKTGHIGVLATTGTVASKAFTREIMERLPDAQVFESAAPLLVPLIEEGEHESPAMTMFLEKYLKPLQEAEVDTIVLGCTHYGHVAEQVRNLVGPNLTVISEGEVVARKLREYLECHVELSVSTNHQGQVTFYSTDISDRFDRLGQLFYGQSITVEKVEL